MTLHGFLDVLQGLFIGVTPRVTAPECGAVRMKDILVRLDHDAEEIRSRRRSLKRSAFHTLMISRGERSIQVRDVQSSMTNSESLSRGDPS
jgi:hypothetical protein